MFFNSFDNSIISILNHYQNSSTAVLLEQGWKETRPIGSLASQFVRCNSQRIRTLQTWADLVQSSRSAGESNERSFPSGNDDLPRRFPLGCRCTDFFGEIIKAMISPIFSSIWTVLHRVQISPSLACRISIVNRSDWKWVPCKGETADLLILNHISNQQIKPKSVNRGQLKAVIYFYRYWSSSHSLETILFLCWRSPSCSVTLFDSRNDLLFCFLSPRRENRLGKRKERNHCSDHSHYHLHYLVRQTPVRLSDLLSSLCLVNRALIPAFSPLTCSQLEMRSSMIWLRWFRVQKLLSCSNGKSFPMQPHSSCVRILSSSSTTSRTILSNSNRKHASSWMITASSSFLVFEAVVMSCERCCRRREMKKRKDRIGTIIMLF